MNSKHIASSFRVPDSTFGRANLFRLISVSAIPENKVRKIVNVDTECTRHERFRQGVFFVARPLALRFRYHGPFLVKKCHVPDVVRL